MSDQKLASSQKRSESPVSQQSKRVKQDAPERPVSSTKMTDINDDCLEHIFKKLRLRDLLNVADASKCFKPAVDQAYTSLFRGSASLEIIFILFSVKPPQDRELDIPHLTIYITDRSTCLKLLRCFGHLITELNIDYRPGSRRYHNEVDRYLNEYCADSLLQIEFKGVRPWTMENIEKPFKNVRAIDFRYCRLGENFSDFNKLFPKLGQLRFTGENFVDHESINKQFPSLYSLSIEMSRRDNGKFGESHFAELMHLNPQIKYVKIHGDVLDAKFLHSSSEHLQTISHLELIWNTKCFNHNGPIHFRDVKILKFKIHDDTNRDAVAGKPMPKIPFSFDHLERLELNLSIYYLSEDIMSFINMHPTLKELFLTNAYGMDIFRAISKLKLSNSLEEIILDVGYFTVDDALDFVRNCESVKNFTFRGSSFSMYDQLRAILGEEWRISYENDVLKLQP